MGRTYIYPISKNDVCNLQAEKKILFKRHFYEKKAIFVFTSGGRYGMFFKLMLQISDPIK